MNETTASDFPQSSPPLADGQQSGLSDGARLVDTFVAPSKTFTDIRRSSRWWLPFLISVLISYAFVFAIEKKVGWDQVADNVIKQTPKQQERFAEMEPTQASQARHTMAASYRYTFYASPLLTLLFAVICGAVLQATINFGFAGEASFGRMIAVWMYGTLPLALKGALGAAALYAGMDAESFNMQNAAGTNVGFYLPPDTNKALLTLASSCDIMTIWTVVLLVIGCAIVGRISRTSAAIAVVGWWVIIVLASVAGAEINS